MKQVIEALGTIAVVLSLIFVGLELRQSNDIATREARAQIVEYAASIRRLSLENSEVASLKVKLQSENVELTPTEIRQARELVSLNLFLWGSIAIAHDAGHLPESSYQVYLTSARSEVRDLPGLREIYIDELESAGLNRGFSEIIDVVHEELESLI